MRVSPPLPLIERDDLIEVALPQRNESNHEQYFWKLRLLEQEHVPFDWQTEGVIAGVIIAETRTQDIYIHYGVRGRLID